MALTIFLLLNISLVSEYSLWYILPCIALGTLYALVLYFRENQLIDTTTNVKRLLFGLRFTLVSLISFLLINPLVKNITREVEKPVIIFAQDNTESILQNKDSSYYKSIYKENLNAFMDRLSE